MNTMHANWNYPTSIRFGSGRIAELPDACRALGMIRPLLVTDRVLCDLPITRRALDLLGTAGLTAAHTARESSSIHACCPGS